MQEEVLFETKGIAGVITLNRPQALNALNFNMVKLMTKQLKAWASDKNIERIIIKGAGEKAFCAGGDIRVLHDAGLRGEIEESLQFWREEYELNCMIKAYPKPFIALIDGIVMGGGVGLSLNGSHIVAGEKFMFAMPEVSIGFFPDVGGSYFLSRMPFESGTYAALTGGRFKQGDTIATGISNYPVKSESIALIEQKLCESGDIDAILKPFLIETESKLKAKHATIKRCFKFNTVESVVKQLKQDADAGDSFALETYNAMLTKSPTSMKLALRQVREGANMRFNDVMKMEFRIVSRIFREKDFFEGVRAVLIDKDNAPVWQPALLKDVNITPYFESLDDKELQV
jgi:enoyl-CoA hydratase